MKLQVTAGPNEGAAVELTSSGVTIGRDEECDLTLEDPEVSRRHATIELLADGRARITDLDSGNGTFVNGRRIRSPVALEGGEELRLGDTTLRSERSGDPTVLKGRGPTVLRGQETVGPAAAGEPLKLSVSSGPDSGHEVEVKGDGLLIGRGDDCGLTINDPEVSRHHASVKPLPDGRAEITDLGSGNGTVVDGRKISAPTVLQGGEEVRLGNTVLRAQASGGKTVVKARARERKPAAAAAPAAAAPEPFQPFRGEVGGPAGRDTSGSRGTSLLAIGAAVVAAVAIGLVVWLVVLDDDDSGSGDETSGTALVEQVAPSIAAIYLRAPGGQEVVNGSGWVLDAEEGLIVTNAHVLSVPGLVSHRLRMAVGLDPDREGNVGIDVRGARVIGVSPCADLAVLRVGITDGLVTLPIAPQDTVEQGQEVFAFGYPENISGNSVLQVTRGVVSAPQVSVEEDDFGVLQEYPNVIQTDAAINPGNSGGPLVNGDGELIGVNTIGNDLENQGFAIGSDEVTAVTDVLRTGESIGWAGFGISRAGPPGILVENAILGTQASIAGFGRAPVVVSVIEGRPIMSFSDYCDATANLGSGDVAVMQVGDRNAPVRFE